MILLLLLLIIMIMIMKMMMMMMMITIIIIIITIIIIMLMIIIIIVVIIIIVIMMMMIIIIIITVAVTTILQEVNLFDVVFNGGHADRRPPIWTLNQFNDHVTGSLLFPLQQSDEASIAGAAGLGKDWIEWRRQERIMTVTTMMMMMMKMVVMWCAVVVVVVGNSRLMKHVTVAANSVRHVGMLVYGSVGGPVEFGVVNIFPRGWGQHFMPPPPPPVQDD